MNRFTFLSGGKIEEKPLIKRFRLAFERSEQNEREWEDRIFTDCQYARINKKLSVPAISRGSLGLHEVPPGMGIEQWSYICDLPIEGWIPKSGDAIRMIDTNGEQIGPTCWLWKDHVQQHDTWLFAFDTPGDMWGPG